MKNKDTNLIGLIWLIGITMAVINFLNPVHAQQSHPYNTVVFGDILREEQLEMQIVYDRAKHIACQEGYYKKGTRAERQHNPGNLKAGGRTDEVNHTIYSSPLKGWLALHSLLYKYNHLTLDAIGEFYAEDENWANGVRRCNPPTNEAKEM